jgi:tetratricopeptide (TPR) repeat protein
VPTFTSAKERDDKALTEYQAVTKQFANSDAGRWSKLGEANTLLALGKHADAAKAFDVALAAAGDDEFLRFRALEGASYALEAEGKRDEAQKKLEELGKLDGGAYKPVAEYHRARLLAASGKRDEARSVLEAQAKAAEAKPDAKDGASAGASVDHFPSMTEASETLLQELGGQPVQRGLDLSGLGGPGGLSPDVIESLRRQMSQQQQKAP